MIVFDEDVLTILVQGNKVSEGVVNLLQTNEAVLLSGRSEKRPNDNTVFTDRRIIVTEGKDLLNMKQTVTVIPYHSIQVFSYGLGSGIELVPEAQMDILLTSGKKLSIKIKGTKDLGRVTEAINRVIL
ncbi:MAG: PH domain-containing protein [Solobacterium sp.]|nr:PH domain-containing protein [Solobacterium sp.]